MNMSNLTTTKSKERNEITLDIQGEFTYLLHRDFRAAYRDEQSDTTYVINLFKTEYMDSSALGMLLLLREHAGGDRAKIVIKGCQDSLRKIFSIARFDELFEII